MRIVLLSPGLFRRPLVRLISSFRLVLFLDGEDHPVFLRTCWGFLLSALAGMNLSPYPGAYSVLELACWGGAWFGVPPGRASSLIAVGFVGLYRFSPVGLSGFFFASLGVVPMPSFGWGFDCSCFGCVV